MDEPSGSGLPTTAITNSEDDEDTILAKSKVLTRQEVLKRRARRLTRLAKCYREHYWSLMEEVRRKHREFYWKYGKSPYIEHNGIVEETEYDIVRNGVLEDRNGDNFDRCNKFGLEFGESFKLCVFSGCKTKAMALTSYCVAHIGMDTKQLLYKRCKSPQTVLRSYQSPSDGQFRDPLMCSNTVLKYVSPYLCHRHAQDTKKQISLSLKKSGASVSLSTKIASKFHFHHVINEYVNHIQTGRRAAAKDFIGITNGNGSS